MTYSDLPPLIRAAGLWRRVSGRDGMPYWPGRLGGVRLVVVPNRDADRGDDDPDYWLCFQAADDVRGRQSRNARAGQGEASSLGAEQPANDHATGDPQNQHRRDFSARLHSPRKADRRRAPAANSDGGWIEDDITNLPGLVP